MLPEGEAFVKEHHIVPLRPLGLMDGERIAVVELVRLPPQSKAEFALFPLKERLQHRDLDCRTSALVFRAQGHFDEILFDASERLDSPKAAVDETLRAIIPQANQAIPSDRQWLPEALEVPHALIVGPPSAVDPDQHLIGPEDLSGVEGGAWNDARFPLVPGAEFAA
jgi:hypothetical protein